ncbi:MAG: 4-hydroxyphenylpyruvate dioxygenase [Sphingomonadales bacterium]|jgi:4-hydroxyphenylpyruvate dioxygenase|nr:4-hydroxyphenylpyruvate dioxygenase [Sphingomonadales bacterium]
MLTSIATVSMSGALEDKLQAVAAAGFDGVEIFENDLIVFPGAPRDVGAMIRDLGLACTLFQPFRDFEGLPDDLRGRALDRAERKFDVMHDLGADLLLVCSSVSPAALPDRGRIVADFRELGDRAAARGLRVGYEALAWGRHVNDHRDAWEIVRQADHPAIGLILDSFHSLVRKIDVATLGAIDPDKIFIVQLADAPWLEMDYLSWSRHFRNLPGQGDIPVRRFVSELLRIGYRGPLSLEIFNDHFRAMPPRVVALDGIRALRLSVDEGARAVGIQVPPAMPPRVKCRGIAFAEFALTREEAQAFAPMLRALGFSHTGRHRSKEVDRWQQGDINIVVNSEPEGFAHSQNVVHGPSLAALGLRVEDVAQATERARMLSINGFEGRVGRGEMKMPAVRDPSGALVYLVQAGQDEEIWRRDFIPAAAEEPAESGAGLLAFDHISYAMSDNEILSWLLYYFAFFEMEKKPVVEVPDPQGLVQIQPVESPDRGLRLILNASAAPGTLSSRLLKRYWGAGVQHLSFATSDIFASAERLAALGLERLPIPDNYYEDLEARFGLAPEMVSLMAAHGILYDRDGAGEYFQLSSRAFQKRFFFEIVERRSYDGYGAANDLTRIAAQSRFKDETDLAI